MSGAEAGGSEQEAVEDQPGKEEEGGKAQTGVQGSMHQDKEESMWRLLWVKVGADGQPVVPFEVKEPMAVPKAGLMLASPKAPGAPPPGAPAPSTPIPSVSMPGSSSGGGSVLSPLRHTLEEMAGAMKKLAAPGKGAGLEEPAPKCMLTQEAREWEAPEEIEAGTRLAWPLTHHNSLDLSAYEEYLSTMQGLGGKTVAAHSQKVSYFYGMFTLPKKFSEIGFMASLFKTGLGQQWKGLPIMSHELNHTRAITSAVQHYASYLLMECAKKQYPEAKRCIELFVHEVLKPMAKKAQRQREVFDEANRELDAQKLSKLPGQALMKKAVRNAMTDLHWLKETCFSGPTGMNRSSKMAINTIAAGLIFTNSYAGRPGEWESLLKEKVAMLQCSVKAMSLA